MQWDLLLGQPGELRSQMIRREQKKTEVRLLDSLEQDTWKCQNQTRHKQQGSATALWDFFLLNRRLQVLNLERLFRVHEAGAKQKQTTKKDLMIHGPKPPHFIWYKISSAKNQMDSTDTYGNWFCTSSYAVCLSEHEIHSNMMQRRDLSLNLKHSRAKDQKTKKTPPTHKNGNLELYSTHQYLFIEKVQSSFRVLCSLNCRFNTDRVQEEVF